MKRKEGRIFQWFLLRDYVITQIMALEASPNLKLAFTQEAEMKMRVITIIIIIIEKKLHCTLCIVLHLMHCIKNIRMEQ